MDWSNPGPPEGMGVQTRTDMLEGGGSAHRWWCDLCGLSSLWAPSMARVLGWAHSHRKMHKAARE